MNWVLEIYGKKNDGSYEWRKSLFDPSSEDWIFARTKPFYSLEEALVYAKIISADDWQYRLRDTETNDVIMACVL